MMTHAQLWTSYQTIVGKDIRRYFRLWIQTLLPSVITTLLYFLIFGHVIGQRIQMHDYKNYATFIAPGLMMLAIINNSFSGTSFALFLAKFNRTIEEVLVSPTPLSIVLTAYMSVGIIRGLMTGIIVGIIAWFFTGFHIYSISLAVLLVILSGLIFSCVGLISAIYSNNFDQVSILPNFVLTPLIYLGGMFFTISALPHPWQIVALFNPIYYVVNAFRYALLGAQTSHLILSMCMIVVLIVVFFVTAIKLFNSKVGMRP